MPRSKRQFFATISALFLGLAACATQPPPTAEAPPEVLTERMAGLFDNSIEPAALGFGGQPNAEDRNLLVERTQNAEFILHARIATVTTEGSTQSARYNIVLQAVAPPISGPKPPSDSFNIVVDPSCPSYRLVQSRDLRLVGTPVIALLRRFATANGPVLRWFLVSDNAQTLAVIRQGLLLSTVRGGQESTGAGKPPP